MGITRARFAWATLVYGRLVFNLLSDEAGDSFTRSWGVSVGLAQANDARDAAVAILKSIATLLVLESFWLLPNGAKSVLAYSRFHKAVA